MLTRAMDRLERLGSSRPAQTLVGACVLFAGIVLGSGWQAATTVATEQATSVNQVCGQGGAAARELTVAGTCEQAAAVVAGPRGLTGIGGAAGADGADGRDGADSTVAGPAGPSGVPGAPGTPGAAGPSGEPGKPGADSTVAGPTGEPGRPGADSTVAGPTGPKGDRGEPGPTCPDGTELQPVMFFSGQQGLGCVTPEQGAPDAG